MTDAQRAAGREPSGDVRATWRRLAGDPSSRPSIFVAAAGLWLAVTPLVVDEPVGYPWWSDVATGAAIAAAGLVRLAVPHRTTVLSLLTVALGGWAVAAPFALGFADDPGVTWNDVTVGMLVVLFAGVAAFVEPQPPK